MNNHSNENKVLETERQKLHNLYEIHGLGHPLVIKQSERLDRIINEYNEQTKKCRHPQANYGVSKPK
ncbi:aspartyl-phosphate phosphatase Spo0E family protein [Paenibacillus sp. LS1]|uniref:aspartyl-phosphate phosphatase Spo0E family protein n=1 Tax=Paenibacillus sp. LS1 TaxID=2992120 RepID=UPI00222F6048|nr:aspartyl-phosphate phosphatase Spo0E family protein [Paenibacillus sp. LS1]MCW3793758.1 aspartyl-phosphate phosphatase Spo0E family protein [Paenibacillus sp. LS1]